MQNEIYSIIDWQHNGGQVTCRVQYDATHPVFSGHFPGQPVVPGVCTMDMIGEMLRKAAGKKLILRSAGQVKFLQLILPDSEPVVVIGWEEADNRYQVTAILKAEDRFLFKMNAVFEAL